MSYSRNSLSNAINLYNAGIIFSGSGQHYLIGNKGAHIYNGNMPFVCPQCRRTFSIEKTLLNQKCTYCPDCKKIYSTFQKFTQHKCTKVEAAPQKTKKSSDVSDISKEGVLIPDDVICKVLYLMRGQWTDVDIGHMLPSEVEVLRRNHSAPECIPLNLHAVNIHYIDSHWLASWQDPCDLTVKIYDSLYNNNRLLMLMPILRLMYDLTVYTPRYITGVTQQKEVSCGAFATAFAVCCAQHRPPEGFKFLPDSKMRQHLLQCIVNEEMTMFPIVGTDNIPSFVVGAESRGNASTKNKSAVETRKIPCQGTGGKSVMNILCEIERQKLLQKKKDDDTNIQGQQVNIKRVKNLIRQSSIRSGESSEAKQKRQTLDRERQALQRQKETPEAKVKRRKVDKETHSLQRQEETLEAEEERLNLQKVRQINLREQETPEAKSKRQKVDKEKHSVQREMETPEATEERLNLQKVRQINLREQETPQAKSKRQKVDKEKHSVQREMETPEATEERLNLQKVRQINLREQETPQAKSKRQKVDKEKHSVQREMETPEATEERLNLQKVRQLNLREHETPQAKLKRQKVDKEKHSVQRETETPEAKSKRQKVDKERQSRSRNPESIEKARKLFLKEITKSPEYTCTVCHRAMYKENTCELKVSNYKNLNLVNTCRTHLKTVANKEWICKTCQNHLKKGNIPPQAQVNNMALHQEPCILDELTDFESRLLAKRIPFMKITALPRGRQRGIIGSVINVPSDVDQTCELLPRTPVSSGIIPVKLKRKQEYKAHVFYEHVRPNKVLEAFQWLKKNNIHYQDVIDTSDVWEETFTQEDSELWDHLTQPKGQNGDEESTSDEEESAQDVRVKKSTKPKQSPSTEAQKKSAKDVAEKKSSKPKEGSSKETQKKSASDVTAKKSSQPKEGPTAEAQKKSTSGVTAKKSSKPKEGSSKETQKKSASDVTAKKSSQPKGSQSAKTQKKPAKDIAAKKSSKTKEGSSKETQKKSASDVTAKKSSQPKGSQSAEAQKKSAKDIATKKSFKPKEGSSKEAQKKSASDVTIKKSSKPKGSPSAEAQKKSAKDIAAKKSSSVEVQEKSAKDVAAKDSSKPKQGPPEGQEVHSLDTCVEISDLALDVSKVMNFSPGEGKTPVGLMMDHGCEEMAFPKLFPTGKFGFDAAREKTITPKKYFNARILNKSGKFAGNTEYLFFAQYITEYKQVMDNISIALRKSYSCTESGDQINSGMLSNSDTLSSIIAKDHAYQFLQTVRGSPPYWQKAMYKLLAAVKQFGIFTFFVTLSSADLKWHDILQAISRQQRKPLTDEEVENLSFEEKSALLRSNPVTAAGHFNHRIQKFFISFLLSPAQPLGKITHYSYRIEFQQRGSPHAHIVIWTEDSPTPEDEEEVICAFIDKYVSCKIPSKKKDPDLHTLVTTLQQHHHTATCRKKGTACRFNFPKLPSTETVIANKLEMDDPVQMQKVKQNNLLVLSAVHKLLEEDTTFRSVKHLVKKLQISMDTYRNALKMTNRGMSVVLQRKPGEIRTNYYNEHLLRAWRANIDVQYCLDPYACISYMVAYITKDEREMSQVLQAVSKECAGITWQQKMKKLCKSFPKCQRNQCPGSSV